MNVRDVSADAARNRRAQWMRQLRQWHWISGAMCLVAMLLFSITGITLNHSSAIEARPRTTTQEAALDADAMAELAAAPKSGRAPVPASLADAVAGKIAVDIKGREVEWSEAEAYISLPRPGGDAWVSIDRMSGDVTFETTDRGWISYLNDLHKGRHTGPAWSVFIDIFALASVVFCITGLLLLQMYAKGRSMTWPLVGFGFALPVLLAVYFIH